MIELALFLALLGSLIEGIVWACRDEPWPPRKTVEVYEGTDAPF